MEKVERQEAEKLQFLRNALGRKEIDSGDAGRVGFWGTEEGSAARATCRPRKA